MKHLTPVHIELKDVDDSGTFEGYGAVFGNVDRGKDLIEPGAFKRSLRERPPTDVKMLFNHNRSEPIGRWESMSEDSKGLIVKGKLLTSLSKGAETLEMMREGIIDSLSIGYRTVKSMYDEKKGVRHLLDVDLYEVSAVIFPMNEAASIFNVKEELTKRDLERILRDAGVPNAFAKSLLSGGYDLATKSNEQRDADKGQTNHELKDSLTRAIKLMEKGI